MKNDPETDLLKIDVDEFDEIAMEFGIRAMPTVVFLKNGQGCVIKRVENFDLWLFVFLVNNRKF